MLGRETRAKGSAVFPDRLAEDRCARLYSRTMHINLGLAFHTHLCSMFHRLRKKFLSGHEQTPRLLFTVHALAGCRATRAFLGHVW